jgi:hypothetical protein
VGLLLILSPALIYNGIISLLCSSFFPDTCQPLVTIISTALFSLLVRLRVCRKPERRYDFGAPTTITVSLPGTDPQDAERRR